MTPRPPGTCIYHITHVDNLPSIVTDGEILSDARMLARGGPGAGIGMSSIKQRRLTLPVKCHPGDHVGDYVPFYFCPRSVMLYVIHQANHPELTYRGGQEPIVHLEAELDRVLHWAGRTGRRWAFSLSNAGARYTQFRARVEELEEVNWTAVHATDFRPAEIKEGKQAEFLVRDAFPWALISRVGVRSMQIAERVESTLPPGADRPRIEVRREWYY